MLINVFLQLGTAVIYQQITVSENVHFSIPFCFSVLDSDKLINVAD